MGQRLSAASIDAVNGAGCPFRQRRLYEKSPLCERGFYKTDAFRQCGDPYENRTRVTAVKGRCLNRLTTGPYGSGNRT